MAAPITPQRVEDEIRRLSRRVEQRADELVEMFQAAAEADVSFKVEHAKTLLKGQEKTVSEREAAALVACERLYRDRQIRQAVADSAKESLRALRDQLNACQSIGANMRAEMAMAGNQYETRRSA